MSELEIGRSIRRRVRRRLEIERGLFDAGVLDGTPPVAALVVLLDGQQGEGLTLTLKSWAIQSCPHVTAAILPLNATAEPAARSAGEIGDIRVLRADAPDRAWLSEARFILFARPGDVLHPSLGASIAKAAQREAVDIVTWNEALASSHGGTTLRLRRPELQRLTLLNSGYIGLGFAVRTELLAAYPGDAFADIAGTNGHLFQLWLLGRNDCRWHTHPECLAVRAGGHQPPAVDATWRQRYAERLAALAPHLEFREAPAAVPPYRLLPRRRAGRVSVIIPFRDEAARTCRCLRSLARQETAAAIEAVLVDNQSSPAARAEVEACLASLGPRVSARIVDYDHPFNHSRQTNLGAAAASGDVLVFLNNDAELDGPQVLEEAAAWALVPGVATVGARILDWRGRLVCAGVRVRRRGETTASSPVTESRDAAFAGIIRETPINTFAFAALSGETFRHLGPLDEIAFPNGYNDVDYCLRARRAGFTHLYLGHLVVRHVPGTSRGKPNEAYQHLTLQLRYPELMRMGLLQLEEERAGGWHGRALERLRRWGRRLGR